MITVSAVARLMPRPPARVERRKQNCCAPGAEEERQVPGGVRAGREGTGGQQRAGRKRIQEGTGTGDCDPIMDNNSPSCVQGSWRRPGAQGGHRAAHSSPT